MIDSLGRSSTRRAGPTRRATRRRARALWAASAAAVLAGLGCTKAEAPDPTAAPTAPVAPRSTAAAEAAPATTPAAPAPGAPAAPSLRARAARGVPVITSSEPLMDIRDSVQEVTAKNFRLRLDLKGLLVQTDNEGRPKGERKDFTGTVERIASPRGSEWRKGSGSARKYNTARHEVDGSGLKVTPRRISGKLRIVVKPDRWVPADKKERTIECAIDGAVSPVKGEPGDDVDIKSARFWKIYPTSQGAKWGVTGTYRAVVEGEPAEGELTGFFSLPERQGCWNMGVFREGDDAGLALSFDMGKKRQNWNHARMALYEFTGAADFSAHSGLRVRVATDTPREDAEISVWLSEEDGSWYYLKSAVPLVDGGNAALALFRDFQVAEWVSPTNHMDEDFVIDLEHVKKLGVGVVNPLGVGEVAFTLRGIDLVKIDEDEVDTVKVAVTGRTLSVNGHDKVQPGVFGGYAPYLPQKYRPGCQRNLGGPSGPDIPRKKYSRLTEWNVPDWQKLLMKIKEQADAAAPSPGKRIRSLMSDRFRQRSFDSLLRKKPKMRDGRMEMPREVRDEFGRLLARKDLYDEASWKGVELAAPVMAALAKLEKGTLGPVELAETNRALLDAAFPELIRKKPDYGPTEAFIIDCWFDRYTTAVCLERGDWKTEMAKWGRAYAERAKAADHVGYLEFWNEPYLNWARGAGAKNYQVKLFRTDEAKEGGPVTVKATGQVVPHFKWKREGGKWKVCDETQFTYWSGRGNGFLYDQMCKVVGKAVKEANPEVQYIVGWGFRWNEDHWGAWDMLYKPTIDRCIEYIDGVHEHHYQGDVTAMHGTYEVLAAYGKTKYGKWLYSYNTETNDLIDAPARGAVDTPEKAKAATQYRRMVYNLRDCVYSVLQSPDKYLSRTVIHCTHTPEATEVCYGLLRDLRGRLVETASDDPRVWCVASVDGTDPDAMPPEPGQKLVVVVFNDHREPRTVEVSVESPTGTSFAGGETERTMVDKSTFRVWLDRKMLAGTAGSTRHYTTSVTIPERSAWKVTLPLRGEIPRENEVRRTQFFSPEILKKVRRGKPVEMPVEIDAAAIGRAKRAWLRLVVEDVSYGEATVKVGAKEIALPAAYTADNVTRIVELPVGLEDLAAATTLVFRVNDGNHAGYRVDMASIVLEER